MKTTAFLVSLLLLTSVSGCYSDHNDSTNYGLDGQWNLTHIGGGISGMDISFDPGEILWTFNESTGKVTIVNNSDSGFSSFPSGIYSFSIENTGDYYTITIDGMGLGSIEISSAQIHIDQRVADGVLLELTK